MLAVFDVVIVNMSVSMSIAIFGVAQIAKLGAERVQACTS